MFCEPFCRQASFCTDFAHPSKEVLNHKAARTCVRFDLGIEMKIDERREYLGLSHPKDLGASLSRDSPPRKKENKAK